MGNWRNSREYRVWRVQVIRRDSICKVCGRGPKEGIIRHAHHLNHSTYFINERFNIDNGVTLCSSCHIKFHTDFKSSTREKCTKNDFNEFNKLAKYFFEVSLKQFFIKTGHKIKDIKDQNDI